MSGPNTFMADAKREEFRKYLEKNGVMDILTKSLAVMYAEPEKPADPLKFLTGLMGRAQTGILDLKLFDFLVSLLWKAG